MRAAIELRGSRPEDATPSPEFVSDLRDRLAASWTTARRRYRRHWSPAGGCWRAPGSSSRRRRGPGHRPHGVWPLRPACTPVRPAAAVAQGRHLAHGGLDRIVGRGCPDPLRHPGHGGIRHQRQWNTAALSRACAPIKAACSRPTRALVASTVPATTPPSRPQATCCAQLPTPPGPLPGWRFASRTDRYKCCSLRRSDSSAAAVTHQDPAAVSLPVAPLAAQTSRPAWRHRKVFVARIRAGRWSRRPVVRSRTRIPTTRRSGCGHVPGYRSGHGSRLAGL